MLAHMRTFARSWIAYLLLFVLIAAFAIWGINDAFRGVGSNALAEVGGQKITPPQLTRELELTLRGQRNQGRNITRQEAIEGGLHIRLLEAMIGRAAFAAYAEKIGVSASDAQVASRIRDIPNVANPITGAFDETAYDAFLQQLGYGRAEFEEQIRSEQTGQMLMEALLAGLRAPASFGAMAFTYETETRVVSIAEAPASAVGAIPAPTVQEIQEFYEQSREQLRVPEYRALTLVYARAGDFAARVEVPEQRVREEFEARRAALAQPERRTYVSLAAQTEAQANSAAQRLARGESADAVASALGMQIVRGADQARAEAPDAKLAEAVFAMSPNSARAVQASLSPWAAVRLEAVTPAQEPNFAALRDELRQAIAMDEASEMLNAAISAFEDARAGGAGVAQAGRQNGLAVVSVPAADAEGRGRDGAPIEALAGQEALLSTAFETPEGEASDFIPAGEADVIVAVDSIIPASVRPLEEVRPQLIEGWIARERVRRLRELGERIVNAVRGGQGLAAAARANRAAIVVASRPLDRRSASQIPARGLAAQIFSAREGEVVTDLRADGGALLLAGVEQINRIDPASEPQQVEAMRAQLQQSLTGSMGEAVQADIAARARPRRNERLLNQVYPRGGDASDEAP